jgi:hypothetical protein
LIIRYAVELARDEIEVRLARHEIFIGTASTQVAYGESVAAARQLPKRGLGRRKSMKIGPNPGRSSVLVNFDAYFSEVGEHL